MDAIREVGPGGHYLGCAHTQANFKSAFWRSGVLDYRPFETWQDAGCPDTRTLANAKARKLLQDYVEPTLDPAIREALEAYITKRKAEVADAFA
jgi:trimethylamine--corrinoid protein Co-methyltransferase